MTLPRSRCPFCKGATLLYDKEKHCFNECSCYRETSLKLRYAWSEIPQTFIDAEFTEYFRNEEYQNKQAFLLENIETREKSNWILNAKKDSVSSAYSYFLCKAAIEKNDAVSVRCKSLTNLLLILSYCWGEDKDPQSLRDLEDCQILYISNFDAKLLKENTISQALRDLLIFREFSKKITLINTSSSKADVFASIGLTPAKTLWLTIDAN